VADRVLGVDACKAGWVGVVLQSGEALACFARSVAELLSLAEDGGEVAVVAIDIPIGLADSGRRRADIEARRAAGVRRSSVFITPVRAAPQAADYATAAGINRQLTGDGISIQAFSRKAKIFEVEAWVRRTDRRVVEVHPEVSFARMGHEPLSDSKVTWAGAERRRLLLAKAGIKLTGDLGEAGRVARVDDVLDAAAAAWSARRVVNGDAISLPNPPEMLGNGMPCAIWV
jgi:predicted RNase H-like nuclease